MRFRFLLVLTVLLTLAPLSAAAEPIVVIVNPANTSSSLSKREVNDIYRGHTLKWSNGQKVIGVNYPLDIALREAFYRKVLDSQPKAEFYRPGSPIPFRTSMRKSSKSILRFVARFEGAIGYLPSSEVDDSVKVVYTFE